MDFDEPPHGVGERHGDSLVGWVEQSETHFGPMSFAALYPSYERAC
jgi:hypothetical protein